MKIKPEVQRWLDLLPIVADRWWVLRGDYGLIRNGTGACPICELANEVIGDLVWRQAANRAAYSVFQDNRGVGEIVDAADNPSSPLRTALKQALGMRR